MITREMAEKEMMTGLSAVCSYCEHWYDAKDRGDITSCGKRCGGPASMMGFPEYKGHMKDKLNTFCFICGKEADAAVEIKGRMIGVCNNVNTDGKTCMEKLRQILDRVKNVVVRERVVTIL